MTAVIILNWNGYNDTIECLNSLYDSQNTEDFYVIVVDNGSADNSISYIMQWGKDKSIDMILADNLSPLSKKPTFRSCILLQFGENLGFAKGNNEAIRWLGEHKPDYFFLLNNDTVVEPNCLSSLSQFMSEHTNIDAITPMICFYSQREKIWNCGGWQKFGFRKYYYANSPLSQIKKKQYIPITFATGCALFFRPSLLKKDGSLFTERFFFGEEDFNLCMRLRQENRRFACVLSAKVYHKVSQSITSFDYLSKTYIYYLNRFIDMRLNTGKMFYWFWSKFYAFYIVALLCSKKKIHINKAYYFQKKVKKEAKLKDKVTKEDFISMSNAQQEL